MKTPRTHFFLAAGMALASATACNAATVALFTNDETNGTASFADEAAAVNVTVSPLVFGASPNGAPYSNGAYSTYTGTGLQFIASNFSENASLSSSDAADRFATFSITADPGYLISLSVSDVIAYTVGGNSLNSYSATTRSLLYVSDQSDFSNILFESAVQSATADTTADAGRWRGDDYTLNPTAGAAGNYQTLYIALELSVNNNTNNGTKQAIVGEMSFDSSVVEIPEPSTSALFGLGGLALIFRRRKA